MRTPPIKGPNVVASPREPERRPRRMGRLAGATRMGTRENAATRSPEQPTPAMARPMMRECELGAAPQTAEPTRKNSIEML